MSTAASAVAGSGPSAEKALNATLRVIRLGPGADPRACWW